MTSAETQRGEGPERRGSGEGSRPPGSDGGSRASIAVVIPAGPKDDIHDTLASVLHFTEAPRLVVVVDDTGRDVADELRAMSPDVTVLPAPAHAAGVTGQLWWNVSAAFAYAHAHFDFDVLLRLDADALLIGGRVAELARARFVADPGQGIIGSSRLGMDGGQRDLSWPAAQLARECGLRGFGRPRLRRTLRMLRSEALAHGYVPGEHPLGAACVLSAAAVAELDRRGWLRLADLVPSELADDHLLGLLVAAAGFRIGEFAGPGDPFALDWKRLPASPEDLVAMGKVAVHSVRAWAEMGEREIRTYFADVRGGRSAGHGEPTA